MSNDYVHKSYKVKPTSRDDASSRLVDVMVELDMLNYDLSQPTHYDRTLLRKLTPEEYQDWRTRALGAQRYLLRERAMCIAYLKNYENEAAAEERAEFRRLKQEAQLSQALAASPPQKVTYTLKGEGIGPPDAAYVQALVRETIVRENQKRRASHREWLRQLEDAGEPLNGLDASNLLRHAHRLLLRLRAESRVEFSFEEKAFLNVIEQHCLIDPDLLSQAPS